MNDYSFGNFLYELRTWQGISQSQLGEMLGVTNKAVSKWENGSAKPNTSLIPKIAEIFGVTVEELFACKRLEKDSELEKIQRHLSSEKRKYAILASVFLSFIITLPLFLIEFICVVMGFGLPDDVVGPIGAVGFIFAFIVSVTAYIIYRKNFKQTFTPNEETYSPRFVKKVKKGLFVSAIFWGCFLALLFSVYLLLLSFSSVFVANIFLSISIFVLIVVMAVFFCFANIKRLLKIKFSEQPRKEKRRIRYSELPLWAKICYISFCALSPFVIGIGIFNLFNDDWLLVRYIVMLLWYACGFPLIIYNIKNR